MQIIKKNQAKHVSKAEGTDVRYYFREEYELHYNEQAPETTQTWHHHEKILESIYIIDGELMAEWKENGNIKKQAVRAGDLVETGNTPHTFTNQTDKIVKFIVIKQVPTGQNKRDILKSDKIIDE